MEELETQTNAGRFCHHIRLRFSLMVWSEQP